MNVFLTTRLEAANSSKKQWRKFTKDIRQHDPATLFTYLGGTPKRGYLCMETIMFGSWNPNFINPTSDQDIDDGWEEKSLVVLKDVFPFRSQRLESDENPKAGSRLLLSLKQNQLLMYLDGNYLI